MALTGKALIDAYKKSGFTGSLTKWKEAGMPSGKGLDVMFTHNTGGKNYTIYSDFKVKDFDTGTGHMVLETGGQTINLGLSDARPLIQKALQTIDNLKLPFNPVDIGLTQTGAKHIPDLQFGSELEEAQQNAPEDAFNINRFEETATPEQRAEALSIDTQKDIAYEELLAKYVDFLNDPNKYPEIQREIQNLTDEQMGTFFEELKTDTLNLEAQQTKRLQEDFNLTTERIQKNQEMDVREKNDNLEELLNDYSNQLTKLDISQEAKDASYLDAIKSTENAVSSYLAKSGIQEAQQERHTAEFVEANLKQQGYTQDQYDKYVAKTGEAFAQKGGFFAGENIKAMNEVNQERDREIGELRVKAQSATLDLEDFQKLAEVDQKTAVRGLAESLGGDRAKAYLDEQGIEYNPEDIDFKGALEIQRQESEETMNLAKKSLDQSKAVGEKRIERQFEERTDTTDFQKRAAELTQERGTQDIQRTVKEDVRDITEEERVTRARTEQGAQERFFQKEFAPTTTREELFSSFAPTNYF